MVKANNARDESPEQILNAAVRKRVPEHGIKGQIETSNIRAKML